MTQVPVSPDSSYSLQAALCSAGFLLCTDDNCTDDSQGGRFHESEGVHVIVSLLGLKHAACLETRV